MYLILVEKKKLLALGWIIQSSMLYHMSWPCWENEESSILFDMKYIEGRLVCFDMEGLNKERFEIEEEKSIEIDEEEKLGPIIVCVDTSASMMHP